MLRVVARSARRAVFWLLAAGLAAVAGLPRAGHAQQIALTRQQCSDAIGIANALVQSNRGRISQGLINSFVRFGENRCDMGTDFFVDGSEDERVFSEFRVRLVALRTGSPDQTTRQSGRVER
jgi:hypothetical protein